jgi:indole-3-glycerol phosphate synthase
MILERIAARTRIRVEAQKEKMPLKKIKEAALPSLRPFSFEKALSGDELAFICEVKKASPSRGVIVHNFPYVKIAKEYEAAGAAAISVLTEPEFFLGSGEYLSQIKKNVSVPVLRKDFIIDEYQIYESATLGADAILLICALLDTNTLASFIRIADSLGLSCLAEAHNEREIASALAAGARVVGVNNRDLRTFRVDLQNSVRLRPLVPAGVLFVSESGIKTPADTRALLKAGADAVLVGETLMLSKNKKEELDRLKGVKE